MAKYIEAEVFKAKIINYGRIYEGDRIPIPFYKEHCGKMFAELLRWVCEEVDDALAADVQEVRHGKWEWNESIKTEDMDGWFIDEQGYVCSECGFIGVDNFNYCPNCGAKMVNEDE